MNLINKDKGKKPRSIERNDKTKKQILITFFRRRGNARNFIWFIDQHNLKRKKSVFSAFKIIYSNF